MFQQSEDDRKSIDGWLVACVMVQLACSLWILSRPAHDPRWFHDLVLLLLVLATAAGMWRLYGRRHSR